MKVCIRYRDSSRESYEIKTDLSGFAGAARNNVRLDVNATITVDFRLGLAGVQETLTVTGQAPLIETTQSKVANTIETTEVQNLPMITRTISGMLELLPGATPVAPLHRTKENVGTVLYAGSLGGNVAMNVDGADNRDNHYSGPLLTFTTESLEQFQLASSQFTAADGRTGGAAVTLVTKSGTNALHGSVFGYERDRDADRGGLFHEARRTAKRRLSAGSSLAAPSAARSSGTGCSFSARSSNSGRTSAGLSLRTVQRVRSPRPGDRRRAGAAGVCQSRSPAHRRAAGRAPLYSAKASASSTTRTR